MKGKIRVWAQTDEFQLDAICQGFLAQALVSSLASLSPSGTQS